MVTKRYCTYTAFPPDYSGGQLHILGSWLPVSVNVCELVHDMCVWGMFTELHGSKSK